METKSKSIASRTRLKEPILIHCNIGETLTPNSCSKIVTEISKYIICNNLIPYHFDTLKKAAENFKLWFVEEAEHSQRRQAAQMKRHHKKIVEAYENFQSIFQNIHLELQNCCTSGDVVEEVVLLIGATSRSPREVYRIILPPLPCVEPANKQNEKKIFLNIIQSVVLSEDLGDMLNRSKSPTNMYVMLKKKQGTRSHWFIPNDSYSLPQCGRQAVIILSGQVVQQADCDAVCKEASAPVDTETELHIQRSPLRDLIVPKGAQWFQSRVSLKGFKHRKSSGLVLGSSLCTKRVST